MLKMIDFALKQEKPMEHIGIEFLKDVPYLTKDNFNSVLPYEWEDQNEDYFKDLHSCATFLREKYNGEVNGLWFIRIPSVDGGIQTITRTKTRFETLWHIQFAGNIGDYCREEMGYTITNDSVENLRSIPYEKWIADGQVYAVFDMERE